MKHITHSNSEVEYNKQTQFIIWTTKQIDPYTIEDEPHILEKSEDQLAFEEMLSVASWGSVRVGGGFTFM